MRKIDWGRVLYYWDGKKRQTSSQAQAFGLSKADQVFNRLIGHLRSAGAVGLIMARKPVQIGRQILRG
jgi:hypothetical protein